MQERNKQTIYLCHRDLAQKTVEVFFPPIETRLSLSPVSSMYLLRTGGMIDTDILLGKLPTNMAMTFVKGDRCYVETEKPLVHDPNCNTADYVVTAINKHRQHYVITLTGRV